MHLSSLLDIAADALGDRVAVAACAGGAASGSASGADLTYSDLSERVHAVSRHLAAAGAERLVAVDVNSEAVPIGLFGAAGATIPYVPVNYRLADAQLRAILERAAPGLAVVEASVPPRLGGDIAGLSLISRAEFLAADGPAAPPGDGDPEDPAVLLFTSGTTGEPKAAVLRHRHLTSYVLETVEFMGADPDDAALVSVPPYHIAGIAAVLSSVWSGRRLVYLPQFSAEAWVDLAAAQAVTHAMVVPTMLGRILEVLVERHEQLPALRHLSYGGGRMPMALVERALEQLPHVGLVNAYGLTETSSTIAVLGPEDHRQAIASNDPDVRHRLGSVGRPLPTLSVEIRDPLGVPVEAGTHGEIWVRGDQVSGEYLGRSSAVSADGWLATNDGGWLDEEGFLFVEGRLDDVIVRGGEPLARRDRRGPAVAPRRGRRRRVRGARRGVGRGGGCGDRAGRAGPRRRDRHRPGRTRSRRRGRATGLGRRAPALHQSARAHRVPARAALQRDRQAAAPGAQGRAGGRRRGVLPVGRTGPVGHHHMVVELGIPGPRIPVSERGGHDALDVFLDHAVCARAPVEHLALGIGEHHFDGTSVAGLDLFLGLSIGQRHAVETDLEGEKVRSNPATGVRKAPPLIRSSASIRADCSARSATVWAAGMAAMRWATRLNNERWARLGWRPRSWPVIGSAHIPSRLNRCSSVTADPCSTPRPPSRTSQTGAQEHAGRSPGLGVVTSDVRGLTWRPVPYGDGLHQVAIPGPQGHPA